MKYLRISIGIIIFLLIISFTTNAQTSNSLTTKQNYKYPKHLDIIENIRGPSIQDKSLSCESSAASDIVSTLLNKDITEDDIIDKLNYPFLTKRPVFKYNGLNFWGNPNIGFVGNIAFNDDGSKARQHNMTGYGVLEEPIAKVFNTYGLRTKIVNKSHYTTSFGEKEHMYFLLKAISQGMMVELWGDWCTNPMFDDGNNPVIDQEKLQDNIHHNAKNYCYSGYDSPRKLEWLYFTEDFKLEKYVGLNGQHTFYLLGYRGPITSPTHIIVWDTDTGYHVYPYSEWKRKWNKMQNRSIIVSR